MDYFDILLAKKLNGGGGSPIDLQTLTVTENGEQDAPSGVAYNKVITNVPAPSNALYKQTLTGLPSPIATFTGADAPIDELIVSIDAVQEGSGDPSPTNIRPISGWSGANVVRVGKNWLSTNFTEGKGINSSGAVVDDSSRSATVEAIRVIPNKTYTVSYTGNERWGWVVYNNNGEKIDSATWLYSGDSFTTPLGTCYVRFVYASETAPTNVQLELGETSTTYEPYNGTTVLISFGQDVYGGVLNVSTGELTILYALIDMGDMTWTYQSANTRFVSSDIQSLSKYPSSNDNPSNIICSNYANNSYRDYTDKQIAQSNTGNVFVKDSTYTDATTFKTAMDGVQLVYELATPQTIQLTPTQVRTILGNNNISVNCGEVTELKFYSETP